MKKCAKCGGDILDETLICPNCGCPVERENSTYYTPPQTNNTLNGTTYASQNANAVPFITPPVKRKNINIKKILSLTINIIGILTGIVTAILGFDFKNRFFFSYADMNTYGGDAYTGIQNAAATAANNVVILGSMVERAVSIILVILGILIVLYFMGKIIKEIKSNRRG